MKEKPILFKDEMVRAILAGNKTQTRRVDKRLELSQPTKYQVGDILWVRETFQEHLGKIMYRADRTHLGNWKPSIFMPKVASRIKLEVLAVRLERVQDITEKDAIAEGTRSVADFKMLWDSINDKRGYSWKVNPYVLVYEFKKV